MDFLSFDLQFGPDLGFTINTEDENTRRGAYRTHYVTIGRLHLIVSRRLRCQRKQESCKRPSNFCP
jgi:hypothetical protein